MPDGKASFGAFAFVPGAELRDATGAMDTPSVTRRRFLEITAAGAAASCLPLGLGAAGAASWPIACLNRPWVKWSVDEMLDGVKAAGYRRIGLQTVMPGDAFIGTAATPASLAALKQKIAARGLEAFQGRLQTRDAASEADEAAAIRKQIDHAQTLGLRTLINTGTAKPEVYAKWYRLMALAAVYGADRGVEIVVKPHGGVTGTAADLLTCLEKVNHPNFRLWYDAGNLIYYTGKDPLAELEPIVGHVKAFTAKDCAAKGAEVMTQFGTGKVDFTAIFRRLRQAGFTGPIVVESCAVGATAAETTANAKANREFLEKALAAV